MSYAQQMHAQLVAALPSNPGRVIFGGDAHLGFDDYTQNWERAASRRLEIPRDPHPPRSWPDGLCHVAEAGQGRRVAGTRGTIGPRLHRARARASSMAPRSSVAVQATASRHALRRGPPDPAGDEALTQRWTSYGQARSCCFEQGPCEAGAPPPISLSCPTPLDGGADASDDASDSGVVGGEPPSTPPASEKRLLVRRRGDVDDLDRLGLAPSSQPS